MFRNLVKNKFNSPLAREILMYVLLASSFFSIFTTTIIAAADYFERIETLERNSERAISLFLPSIKNSLWELNDKQIELDMLGILRFDEINQAKIIVDGNDYITKGIEKQNYIKTYTEPLEIIRNNEVFKLGTLVVTANLLPVYSGTVSNLLFIFIIQLVKSTAVSIVILLLLNRFLIKQLRQISAHLKDYDFGSRIPPLVLENSTFSGSKTELHMFVETVNRFSEKYRVSDEERSEAIQALTELNNNLEKEISQRVDTITRQAEIINQTTKLQEIGKLAGNLAHEINNPLGIISGYAYILVKDDAKLVNLSDSKRSKYLLAIESNVSRIKEIIAGMLRLTYGSNQSKLEKDNLRTVLSDVKNVFSLNSKNKHIKLKFDESVIDVDIYAPSSSLSQVIVCLVTNAIDEIQDLKDPEISFEARINNHKHLEIRVIDNGPGIKSDVKDSLFDPFVTTKPKGEGTGLGLSICVSLLSAIQSLISYERIDGKTHFVITIPENYYEINK